MGLYRVAGQRLGMLLFCNSPLPSFGGKLGRHKS